MGDKHIIKKLLTILTIQAFSISCGAHTQCHKVPFSALAGWNVTEAMALKNSLVQSCLTYKNHTSKNALFFHNGQKICRALLSQSQKLPVKIFMEKTFTPCQINSKNAGLFTGYYSPTLVGSEVQTRLYSTPVLSIPDDLIKCRGKVMKGKKCANEPHPYDDRSTINKRLKKGSFRHHIILWLKSPIDYFFLQIQGSGLVKLTNGKIIKLVFAGHNGHNYYPIGRYLKSHNFINKVSLQTIRTWLRQHSEQQDFVMNKNPRFIFFKQSSDLTVRGFQGAQLTPEHSAAVDPSKIPLGTPLWLETRLTLTGTPLHRALVAQDVGSAIKGLLRADIYFGRSVQAQKRAGEQQSPGILYLFTLRKPA